jgi:hypothetical protein
MDLATNGIVVIDAIKYVNAKMDHLNVQERERLQDIKEDKTQDEDFDREDQQWYILMFCTTKI